MPKRYLSAFAIALLLVAPACLGNILGPGKPSPITAFVNGQGLPDRQPVQITIRIDDLEVIFFKVKFGSLNDIPSGGFYSIGYGLKCRSKIGWMQVNDYKHILDPQSLTYYDPEITDTPLFNEIMWSQLETTDEWLFWGPFLLMLSSDSDTPTLKLLTIAYKMRTYIADWIAWNLLDNPVVQVNREILTVLVTLPGPSNSYIGVRERAQELLSALGPDTK